MLHCQSVAYKLICENYPDTNINSNYELLYMFQKYKTQTLRKTMWALKDPQCKLTEDYILENISFKKILEVNYKELRPDLEFERQKKVKELEEKLIKQQNKENNREGLFVCRKCNSKKN